MLIVGSWPAMEPPPQRPRYTIMEAGDTGKTNLPSAPRGSLRRSLGVMLLFSVIYFNVSGGPFSLDTLVVEVGPGIALLMILLVPLVWGVPESLLVAELASILPYEGGYYWWTKRAFGRFWGFQSAWLTWVDSLVDMAIYPVLFNQYLAFFIGPVTPGERWVITFIFVAGATILNLRGAKLVASGAAVAGLIVLGSFVLYIIAAIPDLGQWPVLKDSPSVTPHGLAIGLSIAVWNYSGWGLASTLQGEVVEPSRTYRRALARVVPFVTLSCLIPILVALSSSDWKRWEESGWPGIALLGTGSLRHVAAAALAFAALTSTLTLFSSLMLTYSRLPLVLSTEGLLPRVFARTDAQGVPTNAVWFSAIGYFFFALFPFTQLIVLDLLLYGLALMMQLGSLVVLHGKVSAPPRAFQLPFGRLGIILLAGCPASLLVTVVISEFMGSATVLGPLSAFAGVLAAGFALYAILTHRGARLHPG